MFGSSLAIDAAILRLTPKGARKVAILLYASSWSTAVMQTHTFSNSVETITLLWTLIVVKDLRQRRVSGNQRPDLSTQI